MDISGVWQFELDPHDAGVNAGWFARPLKDSIHLPGMLQAQGYGDPPGINSPWVGGIRDPRWYEDPRWAKHAAADDFKIPFWLQPERVYMGVAWYQREVDIPAEWAGRHVTLTFERAHWATRAWLDGVELPPETPRANESLSVAHRYSLGTRTAPGRHTLTVRVDNRLLVNVGVNAHSVSDHTQGNWNGLAGALRLEAEAPVYVGALQVYPDVRGKSARVTAHIVNRLGQPGQANVTVTVDGPGVSGARAAAQTEVAPEGAQVQLTVELGAGAQTWSEYTPALYRLAVRLDANVARRDFSAQKETTFGLREVGTSGTQITLNGERIFLRGTLECAIFPLTGFPPTDVPAWKRLLGVVRSYGLNHLRFHSNCPPEAAFQAADEMGFYYQIECAAWANQGATIGQGEPLDGWLYEEGSRIIEAYGNHPSFIMLAYGNEPAGDLEGYLGDWVSYWKARDPRRLYTSGAGWPELAVNDYHNIPDPRIQEWGEELNSRINARPPETVSDYGARVRRTERPIVSHEIGQWCVYPNFAEIAKYTGHLKAKNFEVFQESLAEHGMADQAHDFLIASGKLQVLCYKEEIESAMRTPGFGGIQLLDLHDFPGQGTALVGVLDPFWDDKGYVTGAEYSRFCNAIVPLARLSKRYWTSAETFSAEIDIANFGPAPLSGVTPVWRLEDEQGSAVAQGELARQDVPRGNTGADGGPLRLGRVTVNLAGLPAARRYRLVVGLPGVSNLNGAPVENDWDVWVFPARVETGAPDDVLLTHALDEHALARLAGGGKVLLLLEPGKVCVESIIGFSAMFWNDEWTHGQAPHTLGILVDPRHPLFAAFPTESHSNWQWWDLIHDSAAMHIDGLPVEVRGLVQPIDTWFHNRRLALLFEARVHGGRLAAASMDLENDLDNRPSARQFRRSLLDYLGSAAFNPQTEVSVEALRGLSQE